MSGACVASGQKRNARNQKGDRISPAALAQLAMEDAQTGLWLTNLVTR